MDTCKKCSGIIASLFLIFGILFLLKDLGIWNFWNISAWTVLFIIIGLSFWGRSKCADCQNLTKKR